MRILKEKIKGKTNECKTVNKIYEKNVKPLNKEHVYREEKDLVQFMPLLLNRILIKDTGSIAMAAVEEMMTPIREVFIQNTR